MPGHVVIAAISSTFCLAPCIRQTHHRNPAPQHAVGKTYPAPPTTSDYYPLVTWQLWKLKQPHYTLQPKILKLGSTMCPVPSSRTYQNRTQNRMNHKSQNCSDVPVRRKSLNKTIQNTKPQKSLNPSTLNPQILTSLTLNP